MAQEDPDRKIVLNVLMAVYNAELTIKEAIESVLNPNTPSWLEVHLCAYNDGSTDDSRQILDSLSSMKRLWIKHGTKSRGAGYARNRAAELHPGADMIAILDADDFAHPERFVIQARTLWNLPRETILGCQFKRDPPESTWHYTEWANNLNTERLHLERFREVTLIQPTWIMRQEWFDELGRYIEGPESDEELETMKESEGWKMIHPFETKETARLAEDLRLFHRHLDRKGRLERVDRSLLTYRHSGGASLSAKTSRKLLVQLRVWAWERAVTWPEFAIWGAGRDGKAFFKALSPEYRQRVVCLVDVDEQKLGWYVHRDWNVKIPIVHFCELARPRSEITTAYGQIDKGTEQRPIKKRKMIVSEPRYSNLPVVICVSLYRTNGALEHNVRQIGRTEGLDLWHFS